MSSQNTFPGQGRGRPSARPTQPEPQQRQPSWVNPQAHGHAAQPQPGSAWPPQPGQPYQDSYAPAPGYGGHAPQHGQPAAQPAQDYGHWAELQPGHGGQGGAPLHDPYAPQFEPYTPADAGAYNGQPVQSYDHHTPSQWPPRDADPRGFDANSYGAPAAPQQQGYPAASYGEHNYQDAELSAADWAGQPGGFGTDPYQQPGQGGALGFAQAEGGELDAAYGEDEGDYEDEDAPRSRWPLKIFAALAGAIVIGGGMAYAYKKLTVSEFQGDPPIIKSEAFPAKTKPADAGGKLFPYSDTKIMGRLGDGTSSAPAAAQQTPDGAPQSESAPDTADATVDDGGPRKVSTLVVGRDGSIQPPPAILNAPGGGAQVPGTALVDAFGQSGGAHAGNAAPAAVQKAVTPVTIAKVNSASAAKAAPTTGSIDDQDDVVAPKKKALKKVASADSGTANDAYSDATGPPVIASSAGTSSSTAAHSGFVAVLASIPSSSSSRLDALKRFADMQQKYSSALVGKTPDVLSATLSKGKYDRLVVGPPGSRSEASGVCADLKTAGYKDCWVTSY